MNETKKTEKAPAILYPETTAAEAVSEWKQLAAQILTDNINSKLTPQLGQGLLFAFELQLSAVLKKHYPTEE